VNRRRHDQNERDSRKRASSRDSQAADQALALSFFFYHFPSHLCMPKLNLGNYNNYSDW
jgi:hypothetical protein